MKIRFTKNFKIKSSIPNYPMIGFYAKFGTDRYASSYDNFDRVFKNSSSDLYELNTFIYEDHGINKCRISFDSNHFTANDIGNSSSFNYIFLVAVDLMQYESMNSLLNLDDSKHSKLFTQLAAVISLDESGIDSSIVNIFELGYCPKCSFNCINQSEQYQVEHDNSKFLGEVIYDQDDDTQSNKLIEKKSGLNRFKESVTNNKAEELLGDMTIRKSGLIQL